MAKTTTTHSSDPLGERRGAPPAAPYRVGCTHTTGPVARAVADLCRDIGWVIGIDGEHVTSGAAEVTVAVNATVPGPEGFRIEPTGAGKVRIIGSDVLGVVFGVYAFSERVLGVDPYWFWKELDPQRRTAIEIPREPIVGSPPAFRYRGWFLNDEDLLCKWKRGGGLRDLDYAFYHEVMHPEVLDAVCETLLRTGGNLIIPGSFVDVMNPAEARLVETAVARGLYVTQHHIEPLGVSHYGYETYWRKRGVKTTLHYSQEPHRVRATWRDYARRWYELAGNQVIWQLGLRGRAHQAVWAADTNIGRDVAGRYISQAIADQWAIVQEVDARKAPPATTTLYNECSVLMADGKLDVPKAVAMIFCDDGSTQRMQRDFDELPREPGRSYGAYTHIAYWNRGPHLAAGQPPQFAAATLDAVAGKGDRHYAIINTSNVREHIFGIDAAMQVMRQPGSFSLEEFWHKHLPATVADLGPRYFDALARCTGGQLFQDGDVFRVMHEALAKPGEPITPTHKSVTEAEIIRGAEAMEAVAVEASQRDWPEGHHLYATSLFNVSATLMACMYRATAAVMAGNVTAAAAYAERMLRERQKATLGRFAGWYRGDDKADWRGLTEKLRTAAGVDRSGVLNAHPQ